MKLLAVDGPECSELVYRRGLLSEQALDQVFCWDRGRPKRCSATQAIDVISVHWCGSRLILYTIM